MYCCGKCYPTKLASEMFLCKCGEDAKSYEWHWQKEEDLNNTLISNDDREVLFHPIYSSGTAAVRGNAPFQKNMHYYWEIKMISNLYGTDVMVGVGTSQIVLADWKLKFCSMLGWDANSWGYSYQGRLQHNKLTRKYGLGFERGSLVGVHLDMCNGTLEYYVNRKPLGVAFKQLKEHELYPMVSSTAAQSSVRLCCATSEKPSLQLMCLQVIRKHRKLLKCFRSIPGLARPISDRYFWVVPKEIDAQTNKKSYRRELSLEDEAVLSSEQSLKSRRKRIKTPLTEPRADPDHVMYRTPPLDDPEKKLGFHFDDESDKPSHTKNLDSIYESDTDSDCSGANDGSFCVRCRIKIYESEESSEQMCVSCSVMHDLLT